jgi:hypothetical protein
MNREMLALADMLQAIIGDEMESVVDILAETAKANADAEPDPIKRHRMRWYAAQLLRLRAGPPDDAPRAPRVTGTAAIHQTLQRLLVRVNRMRDIQTLPAADREWLEALSAALDRVAGRSSWL